MTDWQTTYKTNYEQRLRDQYDPATGKRKLLLKWGKVEPCFNLDFRPDSPLCGKCGQRHGIPEPKRGGDDADVCFRCGVSEWKHFTKSSHAFLSNRKFQRWLQNKYV
jgi:hypothetical protein